MQVYYVWYGGWGNLNNKGTAQRPTTVKVLTDMAQSIGGTPWFGTATTYTDQNGAVVNKIAYGGRAGITASSKCWQVTICVLKFMSACKLAELPRVYNASGRCAGSPA